MRNFAYYVDGALSKIICFFMGAAIAGYYVRGIGALLAFSVVFSICVSELYMHVLYGRKPKDNSADISAIEAEFCYKSDRYATDYFAAAIMKKRAVKRAGRFLGVGEVALFCRLKPVSPAPDYVVDAAAYAAGRGYKRTVIAAFVRSTEAQAAAAAIDYIDVRILSGEETARLLKSLHAMPKVISEPKKRKSVKKIFAAALSKNRANAYLFAAILTFVFSRFVRHSVYYIVAAVALLALSFAARFIAVGEKDRDKGKTRA